MAKPAGVTTTTKAPKVDDRVRHFLDNWLECRESGRHLMPWQSARRTNVKEDGEYRVLVVRTCTRCGMERHDTYHRQSLALRRRRYEKVPEGYYSEKGEGRIEREDILRELMWRVFDRNGGAAS